MENQMTIALSIISSFLQNIPDLRMVIYALILFSIMVYKPTGLMGKSDFKIFKRRVKSDVGTKSK